eukprot:592070-Amorphochlora_amoeboformis.AAC.1
MISRDIPEIRQILEFRGDPTIIGEVPGAGIPYTPGDFSESPGSRAHLGCRMSRLLLRGRGIPLRWYTRHAKFKTAGIRLVERLEAMTRKGLRFGLRNSGEVIAREDVDFVFDFLNDSTYVNAVRDKSDYDMARDL